MLLAAAIVVVSNWDTIGRSFRFAGFALATAGLIAVAERLRSTVPTSAGIIAHVGAFLTAGVGIAGLSLFGVTWPTCLLVGGLIAVVATEIQSRRWEVQTFLLGQVAGVSMAATGLGDLTGTTGGLVAAIAAGGLLVAGAQRRAAAISILALLSPLLTALTDAGIGAGTLARAGLVGERLSWSGPMVGVMAALVLGIVATQRRNNGLTLMAVFAPVIGIVTGLSAVEASATAWLSVPALVVIAAELGWWLLRSDRFSRQIATVVTGLSGTLAVMASVTPQLAVTDPTDSLIRYPWALPVAITLLAMALATTRLRRADHHVADLTLAAAAVAAGALAIAFDASPWIVALASLVAVPASAFFSRRLHPIAVYLPATWALEAIVDLDPDASTTTFLFATALFASLVGTIVVTRARLAAGNHWMGWVELTPVTAVCSVTAIEFVPEYAPAAVLTTGSLIALAMMLVERRVVPWGVAAIGTLGLLTADAAIGAESIDPSYWFGWTVAAAALFAASLATGSRLASYGGAAASVGAAATLLAGFHVTAEEFIGATMVAVAALTGLAFTIQRRSPLDAAAIAAGVVLLATTVLDVDPAWISAIWVVLGLQVTAYGFVSRLWPVALGGAVVTLTAAASSWFTTGLHGWFVDAIAPAGITVGDLWAAAASVMALVVGNAARRHEGVNSWVAYSGALTISGLWLTSVQIDRETVWALPLAITIGLIGVAIGGWRRLAAPLVGGTLLTAVSIFVASGSDLREIPTWAWLAVGGTALLAVAVLIERASSSEGGLKEVVTRWN